jgi:phage terminase large subunit
MIIKALSTGYQPRPLQQVMHQKLQRFNVIVCHRRFGKTVFSINEMIDKGLHCTWKNPQLAYIAPTYGQAERIAWQMLKEHTKMLPNVEYNESKLRAIIPRPHLGDKVTIYLMGAENPDAIRGMYLDFVVFDEFSEMNPEIWSKVVRPAVADRKGGAIFIGTPKGQNHFYDVYKMGIQNTGKGWFTAIYKASQTGILPPEEIEAMKAEMTEDEIEQELECSFTAAITGAYWGKQISELEGKGRFGKVPFDPSLQVDTFWDLGVSDTTAVWFVQQVRQEVRIIDYWEATGFGIPDFAKMLKAGHRAAYDYRDHNWPHDGNSRDLSTGQERSVTARGLGIKPLIVHPRYDVADSIDAGRRLLARCWFDVERCTFYIPGDKGSRGIESLKNYTKKWDAKNKIYQDNPLHNWASHGADGFRLMGMALKPGKDRNDRSNLPRQSIHEFDIFKH